MFIIRGVNFIAKKKKPLTGFPLANMGINAIVGEVTTGMGMKALGDVKTSTPVEDSMVSGSKTMLTTGLLLSNVPKKRRKK